METVSRDDIKELRSQATATATDVASMKATMTAGFKQIERVVELLQGNGQRGLLKDVAKHGERLDNHDGKFKERRDTMWKVLPIATTVALAGASAVAWLMIHFSQGH